ncbi:MAG: IMPACT family protein [Myxococcota bacterium]
MDDLETSNSAARPYNTLADRGESELVVERSRFLGFARPVDSVDAAMEFVEALEKQHYDARHVCYGLRVGRGAQSIDRSNDDGEPARTGGFPLWQLLDGEEVTDAIIVVVRYYGGTKLGTGGLARAYRDTGRAALEDSEIVTRHPETVFDLTVPYSFVDQIEHLIDELDAARVIDTEYAAEVSFQLAVRTLSLEEVRRRLATMLQRPIDDIGPEQD